MVMNAFICVLFFYVRKKNISDIESDVFIIQKYLAQYTDIFPYKFYEKLGNPAVAILIKI